MTPFITLFFILRSQALLGLQMEWRSLVPFQRSVLAKRQGHAATTPHLRRDHLPCPTTAPPMQLSVSNQRPARPTDQTIARTTAPLTALPSGW
jgi:hypothetical protein